MVAPRVCVLRAPGTNCDVETAYAFETCGAIADRVHLFQLLENPKSLANYQALCVPGGFSYGDDIGSGVIFASQLRNHLAETLGEFLQRDTLMLGICNGFQVLLKSGILPGGACEWPPNPDVPADATLTWNDNGKYTALWVRLKVGHSKNVFLRGLDEFDVPIAHGEGKLVVRDPATLDRWQQNGQCALSYTSQNALGEPGGVSLRTPGVERPGADAPRLTSSQEQLPFPINPNGSMANLAGLSDPSGRVLGLMPHPERFLFATQHPHWTRLGLRGEGAGLRLFRNAVDYFL
ncbi:MAG: phosphoribosylformylglycinamidine synthase subunit PurQ [Planctomycetaceae bacterium]